MLDSKRPAKTFRGFEQNEKDNLKNEIVKKNIKREESNNFIRDKKRNDMVPVDNDLEVKFAHNQSGRIDRYCRAARRGLRHHCQL